MAAEQQIAADRRNALSSTGPRPCFGKKRASQNAFQHGLTLPNADPDFADELEQLTRQFADDILDDLILIEFARNAVEAAPSGTGRRTRLALVEALQSSAVSLHRSSSGPAGRR
jgi:hypothetical protein